MTEDGVSDMPLMEDWSVLGSEGQTDIIDNYDMWKRHFRTSLANSFENELCSCGGVYDKNVENHYKDETEEEQYSRDKWKMEQAEMIKEYLNAAYRDLEQKKEMFAIKQERLRIAREELNAKLEALNRAKVAIGDMNSVPTINNNNSNSSRVGIGRTARCEELRSDVEAVKQRIKQLILELVRMRSSVTMSEKGIYALTMVNKMISDRGRREMQPFEAGEMARGIRGMGASIKAGERRKRELMESVADLSRHFLARNANWNQSSPSNDAFACIAAASRMEPPVDVSKRHGTIAKLKSNLEQNKRCIMEVLEELIEVENRLVPCSMQFDANRVLLIEEKDKLLQEMIKCRSPSSDERIRNLEQDLYKVKEIYKMDIQLDNQRLDLTKRKVMLEEELLERAKMGANLELHIKSLYNSVNSISSGSSLGSLGSLSASSGGRGSQNSLVVHDLYSMHELNRSLAQANASDLHARGESAFHEQLLPPPSRSLSSLPRRSPASPYLPPLSDADVCVQSFGDVGRSAAVGFQPYQPYQQYQQYQQYPTVREEKEDGDEGFEGLVEEEERGGSLSGAARSGAAKPPPSYEDHVQLTVGGVGVQKMQQQPPSGNRCLYQQPPQLQVCQRSNDFHTEGFEKFNPPPPNYANGPSYCLYQQSSPVRFGMSLPSVPLQDTQKSGQRQDLYRQQANAMSGSQCVFQAPASNGHPGYPPGVQNAMNVPTSDLGATAAANYSDTCQKFYNYGTQEANGVLTSNSLPTLINASSMVPATNCVSESQIYRWGLNGGGEEGAYGYQVNQAEGRRNQSVDALPSDEGNRPLRTEKLPTVSRSLLREFGVENGNVAAQGLEDGGSIVRNLRRQKEWLHATSGGGNFVRSAPRIGSMESSFAVSMPTCHTAAAAPETFSPKSSSTSHLHGFDDSQPTYFGRQIAMTKTMTGGGGFRGCNDFVSLSMSSASHLDEGGSNVGGSDRGVFEAGSRLINILSAQVHLQIMYDSRSQEILVCIERVRNLSAISIHNYNELVFKVHILPSANYVSYVEDTDPSSPQHLLPSHSNIGKIFHFLVEPEKVLSKTVQVTVLRLKDQKIRPGLESMGVSLISLASFDLKSCLSSWYNILCLNYMDSDASKCLPPPVPLLPTIEIPESNLSEESESEKKSTESNRSTLKDESSDSSTIVSSQTSTLARVEELEDTKSGTKAFVGGSQMADSEGATCKEDSPAPTSDDDDDDDAEVARADHPQRAAQNNLLRKPIAPGSKLNIRRWQTFSPEGGDHTHKLSRSGSDSSVRRKGNSHFDRHAANRQSIRLKTPLAATKKSDGVLEFSKNHTTIDLMVDYQSFKTKLETLDKEIFILQAIKQKLEEAKEKGETEPSWLQGNEELQALLRETSETFREKAFTRGRLSDITDLANRRIRKAKMELLSLQAKRSIGDIDRVMFKKKMNFFTSPDGSLSFLDQIETEIDDDPICKDGEVVDQGSCKLLESKVMSKNAPLSIKSSCVPGIDEAENFENMLF